MLKKSRVHALTVYCTAVQMHWLEGFGRAECPATGRQPLARFPIVAVGLSSVTQFVQYPVFFACIPGPPRPPPPASRSPKT
jgi:hypothetical protein